MQVVQVAPSEFQDRRRIQPLCHSSVFKYNVRLALAGVFGDIFEIRCCILVQGVTKLSSKLSSFAGGFRFESRFACV